MFLLAAPAAHSATFVVDRLDIDREDLAPGDGKCEWFPVGSALCTLRAAVEEANALPGADTIIIPGGAHITLDRPGRSEDAAATGDLDITDPLTIGALAFGAFRPVVDAGGLDRVFDVYRHLTLVNLQVVGGSVPGGVGGGIRTAHTFVLDLDDCRIAGNSASSGGGVYIAIGPGLPSTFVDCLFEDNTANWGAAINLRSSVVVRRSLVRNNHTGSSVEASGYGTMELSDTTVAFNDDDGIQLFDGVVSLTLSGDTVFDNQGYGVRADCGAFDTCGDLTVRNSIIAGNAGVYLGGDCRFAGFTGGLDIAGNNNLDSDGSCPLSSALGDLPLTQPQLGLLQFNGGVTDTMVPKVGSPVIDAGESPCSGTDQRGATRPLDGDTNGFVVCDIGAVEVLPCDTAPPTLLLSNVALGNGTTEACRRIQTGAGVEILAGANHTFRYRDEVILGDGLSVNGSANFSVIRDWDAGSSIAVP